MIRVLIYRPGFLLVVVVHFSLYPVYIHVYTHTYSASCSCDLEPEPTNSHRSVSLFFDLSIRAEKSSAMKIDATFVICGTEKLFVFRKKRIIVFTFILQKEISIRLGYFSNEFRRNSRGGERLGFQIKSIKSLTTRYF